MRLRRTGDVVFGCATIEEEDGTRIYASRRWPRGIAKGERFSNRFLVEGLLRNVLG